MRGNVRWELLLHVFSKPRALYNMTASNFHVLCVHMFRDDIILPCTKVASKLLECWSKCHYFSLSKNPIYSIKVFDYFKSITYEIGICSWCNRIVVMGLTNEPKIASYLNLHITTKKTLEQIVKKSQIMP